MLTGRGTVSMELNIADICDALAGAYPERECLIFRDRRLTWADVADRTDRLAAIGRSCDNRPIPLCASALLAAAALQLTDQR